MYFYTGPGGATNESPLNSDDEEEGGVKVIVVMVVMMTMLIMLTMPMVTMIPQVKEKSDSARKSGRANKGKNSRLERADEVVEMPQAKVGHGSRRLTKLDVRKDVSGSSERFTPSLLPKFLCILLKLDP